MLYFPGMVKFVIYKQLSVYFPEQLGFPLFNIYLFVQVQLEVAKLHNLTATVDS